MKIHKMENAHQAMLTVFNWTEESHTRALELAQLGLNAPGSYKIVAVLGDDGRCNVSAGTIKLTQKPRSVRMLKLVDNSVPAIALPIDRLVSSPRGTGGPSDLTGCSFPIAQPRSVFQLELRPIGKAAGMTRRTRPRSPSLRQLEGSLVESRAAARCDDLRLSSLA
jgi:hypothetical protein